MNTKNNKLAPLMAVATAMVLIGMSGSALATHVDDPPVGDNGSPFTYIGLGIGDHVTTCVGGWTDITVDVENPTNGNSISPFPVTVPVGSGGINNNAPLPCLGGAVATSAGSTLPSDWTAWAVDSIYSLLTPTLDIVPSGFARLTVTETLSGIDCAPAGVTGFGSAGGADVCTGTSSQSATVVATQFSFCGQGSGNVVDPGFHSYTDPDTGVTTSLGGTQTVTRAVFLSGPLFFSFDCNLHSVTATVTSTVAGAYDDNVVPAFNGSEVCQGAGPFEDPTSPPTNPPTNIKNPVDGEDVTIPWLACLFPFPATGSPCYDSHWQATGTTVGGLGHVASIALIGDVGWVDNDPMSCQDGTNSNWGEPSGGGNTIGISNFPVQVTFN